MINDTILLNFSNISMDSAVYGYNSNLPSECFISGKASYSVECLYKFLCPQFTSYFIRTGLIIIISYIVISWLLWWFMKYGYKIMYKKMGSDYFMLYENRVYWEVWIRQRMEMAMLIFITVVVWLSISG